MAGMGLSPFGSGPYGLPSVDPPADRDAQFVSSRFIANDGTPEQLDDGTGGFRAMSDAMQQVLILLAYGVTMPEYITSTFDGDVRAQVDRALLPLTSGKSPRVALESIETADNGGSFTGVRVAVRDLTDFGKTHVVPVNPRSR